MPANLAGIGNALGASAIAPDAAGLSPLPLSPTLSTNGLSPRPQAPPSPAILEQLNRLKAEPVAALEDLKASAEPGAAALYQVVSHPEALAGQKESLTALLGPENFKALAETVEGLRKLAGRDSAVRGLLSSGGDPAAALDAFKKSFDGAGAAAAQDAGRGGSGTVAAGHGKKRPRGSGLSRPASDPEGAAIDRDMLSLAEKIARGITRDEGLKLEPWESRWEGDRPAWRLLREGGHLRVQYVPEDLRHADRDAAMAHLMQEIFRAVYSRPDLIEPELRSNGLFQTLYDAVETGRVVRQGLNERPGLGGNFEKLNREQYRDPQGQAAAQAMSELPSYLQFLEGALYEARAGRQDPRVKDPRVLDALERTRESRQKIASASPEQAYKLTREIWPALERLHTESEDAAMSRKLFEKLGEEGKPRPNQEQAQKEIEKLLKDMTPEQRENLRKQVQEQLRRQEQDFRKTMGKRESSPEQGPRTQDLSRQLEQAASRLAQEAARARGQARDLQEKASQMRAQTGARDIDPQEAAQMDAQASDLRRQAEQLGQAAEEFRRMAEELKRGASSSAARQTSEQARQLEDMGKDLQNQSSRLQERTRALKKQLERGQGEDTSSLRQKAAGIERASKEIADKAGDIQEEAQKAQALSGELSRQLSESKDKDRQGQEEPSQGSPAPSGQTGEGDVLEQMLKDWSEQKQSGQPGQGGESGDPRSRPSGSDADEDSGGRGSDETIGRAQEEIERIRSGGLDASQRSRFDEFMGPIRGMVDTLSSKLLKRLKDAMLGRSLTGLFSGDIDEDALPYYKVPGVGIMKEDLLPGRRKAKMTMLIDMSGSMKSLYSPADNLYHASRALALGLKALARAFKNQKGVEVRVVGYNQSANIPLLGYTQAKDLTDAVVFRLIEAIDANKGGITTDVKTLRLVVEDIREDMKKHPDTGYAVLHMGDGNPDDDDVAPRVAAIYNDPANAKIRFGNLAAGPAAGKMYTDYKPHSFWAKEITDLGTAWAEMVEAVFKKAWRTNP